RRYLPSFPTRRSSDLVGRSDGAGDKARLAVLSGDARGGGAREPGALAIELVGEVRHVVVGLRDRGRGKRVGGDDVGAGAQIVGRSEEHTSELQSLAYL